MNEYMKISSDLLNILVCPVSGKKLAYDKENDQLISLEAKLVYPIVDGIPIVLKDKAKKLSEEKLKKFLESESIS